jgi:AcrR family transcriptional regulator
VPSTATDPRPDPGSGDQQPAPRWRRLTSQERRRQIIAVAKRLFAEKPYSEVSTTEIAHAAGVTHGLLTYHFGSKRNLYLTVLKQTLSVPTTPVPRSDHEADLPRVLDRMTEWWLNVLERDRETWLSALGARGIGRDPEVEAILTQTEERARAELVALLSSRDPAEAPPELWAIVAAWQGLAEATGVEWLTRGRITRHQAKVLLIESLNRLLKMQGLLKRARREEESDLPEREAPAAA